MRVSETVLARLPPPENVPQAYARPDVSGEVGTVTHLVFSRTHCAPRVAPTHLRRPLSHEAGDEAFERHILLAVRVHRAAGLNARASDKEGQAWRRYFVDYFPPGRNSDADARFLWENWRTRLLKHESPIGITHGQESLHWYPLDGAGFCVNLESMWDDFEYSVDRFLEDLAADKQRRGLVVRRWRERSWTVRKVTLYPSKRLFPAETLYPGAAALSAANPVSLSTATSMTTLRRGSK
jgi:hypothetical protein